MWARPNCLAILVFFANRLKSSTSVVFNFEGGSRATSGDIRGGFPNTKAYGEREVEHAAVVRTLIIAPWSSWSQSV